jgi:probable aminopeptidase NPEPL1
MVAHTHTRLTGLLWGVGKASVHKPALVVLSHVPAASTAGEGGGGVAMCGKGIVYDTGGL